MTYCACPLLCQLTCYLYLSSGLQVFHGFRKPWSQLGSDVSSGKLKHSSEAGLLPVAISSSLRFVRSGARFSPTWLKLETSSLAFNRLKTSVCPWQSKLRCLRQLGFLSRSSCMISYRCCYCLTMIAIALDLGGSKDAH